MANFKTAISQNNAKIAELKTKQNGLLQDIKMAERSLAGLRIEAKSYTDTIDEFMRANEILTAASDPEPEDDELEFL